MFRTGSLICAMAVSTAYAEDSGGRISVATNAWAVTADQWHGRISSGIESTVDRVDRFFGDDRILEDNHGTVVRAGMGVEWNDADGPSLVTRFSSRLALPNLEERLQIIFDNMTESEDSLSGRDVEGVIDNSEPDAGVRYILKDDGRLRFSADGGLRLESDTQVFGRLRGRLTVPCHSWELRLSQSIQWFSIDGWRETSEMRWSRMLGRDWVFQLGSRLTWRQDEDGVSPGQAIEWRRVTRGTWGHRFLVSAEWPNAPDVEKAAYIFSYGHRRLIYRDWLYVEFIPGFDFSQVRDYEINPRMAMVLEVVFGRDR